MDLVKLLVFTASFVGTVGLFVFLVRWARIERRIYWIVGCSVSSIVWLGLVKGPMASIIAIAFTSGYVSTRLDARRIGKRIADSMGIGRNLFFSSIEQTMPLYLTVLATLDRQGEGVANARRLVLPYLLNGLDVLEQRFGQQPQINAAREAALPFWRELVEDTVQK